MGKENSLPTIQIVENSLPEAYYSALKAVYERGMRVRTEYDRKNDAGDFIDPPSRDAKVMIEVTEPFAQPRFAPLSYDELGKYVAEFLGAKDHLVVPTKELVRMLGEGADFEPTQWPYAYHQRLAAYPLQDGGTINQLEMVVNRLANDPITRRAVMMTGVPWIDLYIKGDLPCLREVQLRALENEEGQLVLHSHVTWRSRDLFKAWGDNVVGFTNLLQFDVAPRLAEKTGKEVVIGPYTEVNGSLHIYGQDWVEKGMDDTFFDKFPTKESFVARSMDSDRVAKALMIPQLEELRDEETWHFPQESIELIDRIAEGYRSGEFVA